MKVYRGPWNPAATYGDKDGVSHHGKFYFAVKPTTGRAPDEFPRWWQECDPPPEGTLPEPRPLTKTRKDPEGLPAPPTGETSPFAG